MSALAGFRHPAVWYLGIALGLPAAGGAELDAAFAEHALTVLAVSAAVLWIRRLSRGPAALPSRARGRGESGRAAESNSATDCYTPDLNVSSNSIGSEVAPWRRPGSA